MSVYAFSDIHGQRKLFDQVMAEIGPDDTVYFLGDAIDRGPNGWAILKELMNDPRVIYIKGNHEDMMCNALWRYPDYPPISNAMSIWNRNGNIPTLTAIDAEGNLVEGGMCRRAGAPRGMRGGDHALLAAGGAAGERHHRRAEDARHRLPQDARRGGHVERDDLRGQLRHGHGVA